MTDTATLQSLIETAFEKRADINPRNITRELRIALDECLDLLDSGAARVAEPHEGGWRVNDWLKKAVLLYFRAHDNRLIEGGHTRFFDKVPLKYAAMDEAAIRASGVRIVPMGRLEIPLAALSCPTRGAKGLCPNRRGGGRNT